MEVLKEQVELARQALINIERPYLFVENVQIDFPETKVGSTENDVHRETKISYTMVNYGRVPAVVKAAWVRARRRDDIPDEPDFEDGKLNFWERSPETDLVIGSDKDSRTLTIYPAVV